MRLHLQKIGTLGLFLTAITSPCCFPLFGFILTALGVGSFELFGEWSMTIFMFLTLLSLGGLALSYRMHKSIHPLLIAIPSATLIFFSYYLVEADYWLNILYAGMFGMLLSSIADFYRTRQYKKSKKVELQSIITCPKCGHQKEETMPTDACTFFYECESCGTRLKPKTGDCCVFCSYGTVKCPPIQMDKSCCA
ncbi:MAG: MerC family mercury resistance protein [Chitinophagales bacterium]|nr:MerC family mercury resistance protein [Chitinophagales bacterium]MBS1773076.1 MerC family mercury resistance protein [Bacteroidota bacterium]